MKERRDEPSLMTITSVVALGGSTLRPEEDEDRARWFGRLRQIVLGVEGEGRRIARLPLGLLDLLLRLLRYCFFKLASLKST